MVEETNEITFEFVQHGEFDDPYYRIWIEEEQNGTIGFDVDEWILDDLYYQYHFTAFELRQIANKLDELNESTRKQRIFIFNWF